MDEIKVTGTPIEAHHVTARRHHNTLTGMGRSSKGPTFSFAPAPLTATYRSGGVAAFGVVLAAYMVYYLYHHHYAPGKYGSAKGWGEANWFWHRGWIQLHFLPAATMLFIIPFQIWKYYRDRYRRLHRILGRLFFILVVVSMTGAAYFCFFRPSKGAPTKNGTWFATSAFQFVFFLTLFCSALSWIRARQLRFAEHRRWVLRVISFLWGAVAQRFFYFVVFPDQYMVEYPIYTVAIAWLTGIPFGLIAMDWWLSYETARDETKRMTDEDGRHPLLFVTDRLSGDDTGELIFPSEASHLSGLQGGGSDSSSFSASSPLSSSSSSFSSSSKPFFSVVYLSIAAVFTVFIAASPSFWPSSDAMRIFHGAIGLLACLLSPASLVYRRRLVPIIGLLGLFLSFSGLYYSVISPPGPPPKSLGVYYLKGWKQLIWQAQGLWCWALASLISSCFLLIRHSQEGDKYRPDERRWLLRLTTLFLGAPLRRLGEWIIPVHAWSPTAFVAITNVAWEVPLILLEWCVLSRETAVKELAELEANRKGEKGTGETPATYNLIGV